MPTAPTPINPLPTPPSTGSSGTFDADADAFVAALPAFRTEANALATNAFGNATDADAAATDAAAQVVLAAAQVVLATTQANNADTSRIQAQTAAAAAAIAAGAAIPAGYGQLYKTEGAANVKTTTFTAATGRAYDCDTTGGAFTGSLPATPAIGDLVTFRDYASTWATNNFTVGRNGQLIAGDASDFVCDINNLCPEFVFVGGTKGWAPQ